MRQRSRELYDCTSLKRGGSECDMTMQTSRGWVCVLAIAILAWSGIVTGAQQATAPLRSPDVIYVPTPPEVVDAMLVLANVSKNDVVYDLGSGDGRIPIAAAQKYGARAVGIDINPQRIQEANENLAKTNLGNRVRFLNQDLFETDISEASVVTLYLLQSLNIKLIPKLKALRKGTRIVSHSFSMGDEWAPEKTQDVGGRAIYLWTIK
jgi:precorrin-6B methylase 2